DSNEAVVRLADQAWPRVHGTMSSANVASSALSSAVELPDSLAGRSAALTRYEAACRQVLADPALPLTGDDRSGIYFALEDAREAEKDSVGLRAAREEHVAMLEAHAAQARSAEQRAVYDAHRLSLYIARCSALR